MAFTGVRITGATAGTINLNDHVTFSIAKGWRPAIAAPSQGMMGNRPPADPVWETIPLILHVATKAAALAAINNLLGAMLDAAAWRDNMRVNSVRLEINPHPTTDPFWHYAPILAFDHRSREQLVELAAGLLGQIEGPAVGPIELRFLRAGMFHRGVVDANVSASTNIHEVVNLGGMPALSIPGLIRLQIGGFSPSFITASQLPSGGYVILTGGDLVGNQRKIGIYRAEDSTTKTGTWANVADATAENGNFTRYTPTSIAENLDHGLVGWTQFPTPGTPDLLQNGLLYGVFVVCRNRSTTISYNLWIQPYRPITPYTPPLDTAPFTVDTSTQDPRVVFIGTFSAYSSIGMKLRVLPSAVGVIGDSLDIDSIVLVLIDEHTHIVRVPSLSLNPFTASPQALVLEHQYGSRPEPRAVFTSVAGTHEAQAEGDLIIQNRTTGITAVALFTSGTSWRAQTSAGALTNNAWTIHRSPMRYIPT